jgi:hypothetical protein
MNERIEKLAKQAGGVRNYGYERGEPIDRVAFSVDNLEKFAELIVEECVAQCWSVSELEHKGSVVSECSKRMRKHFGVTE